MPDTQAGEGPDPVCGYNAVTVDCRGNLEDTETLAGGLARRRRTWSGL